MLWVGRIVVLLITVVAFLIAINPNSGSIMDLVENAWAGFGSAFGPVILLSLFWSKFTYRGAVAGIVGGAVSDVLWLVFLTGPTGIYELVPGFLIGFVCAVAATWLDDSKKRMHAAQVFENLKHQSEQTVK